MEPLKDQCMELKVALRELLAEVESLEDVKFSRDFPPHEAQAQWDFVRSQAREALKAAA